MKLFIASVVVLLGIVLFLFALFPADMSVGRVVLINAPRDSVIRAVSDLGTWKNWNELARESAGGNAGDAKSRETDPIRLKEGNLSIHLLRQTKDSVITQWQDASGRSFLCKFTITESGGQSIVQWNLEFHLHWYPWEKFASMFYDKQLGPLMEKSLVNLRKSLERA